MGDGRQRILTYLKSGEYPTALMLSAGQKESLGGNGYHFWVKYMSYKPGNSRKPQND